MPSEMFKGEVTRTVIYEKDNVRYTFFEYEDGGIHIVEEGYRRIEKLFAAGCGFRFGLIGGRTVFDSEGKGRTFVGRILDKGKIKWVYQ